jgi:Spy/CpxP family protein refolding chaperone
MAFSSAKLVSLFASVVALATIGSQVALAQQTPTRPTTAPPANSQPQSIEDFLGLSQDQVQKIRSILIDRQTKIEQVLTQDQRTMLSEAMRTGQNAAPVLQQLNLSQDQKTRIGTIVQASNQQIRSVLTPEQLKKLESQIQQNQTQSQPQSQPRR